MKIKLKLISFIIFNSLAFSGTTGKLVGKIMDKDTGNPLIGCNVIIEDTYMGTSSNELGEYILLNIPPGNYNVRFEMIGYKRVINDGVTIISDKTITLNGDLVSSVIEGEEVIVLAEKKLIQFDVTQSEAIISSEELDGMPVTEGGGGIKIARRGYRRLDGGIHMRGGRTSEVSYMVDGVPMSDVYKFVDWCSN